MNDEAQRLQFIIDDFVETQQRARVAWVSATANQADLRAFLNAYDMIRAAAKPQDGLLWRELL